MTNKALMLAGLCLTSLAACRQEVEMPSTQSLKEGMHAPDFTAAMTDGTELSLRSLRGKTVVLYFYPKDDTPGCTKEACSFRDARTELAQLGVAVLGVSRDSVKSHQRFTEKHALNFPLLADPEGHIVAAYQSWKEPPAGGGPAKGINRSTFLIDGEGVIRRIWRSVKVDGHLEEVLSAVRAL
jgi:peroxiredoxin Q/BCP